MWWGKRKRVSDQSRDVVREAERMLEGRTLETYIARRKRVPAWSLVALLGHGTRRDLLRLASPLAAPDPSGWSGAVAHLARELLAMTGDEPGLLRLQRRALIPLELLLLGGRVSAPATPADLLRMVSGSLETPLFPEY
jgi:hypothetical protein